MYFTYVNFKCILVPSITMLTVRFLCYIFLLRKKQVREERKGSYFREGSLERRREFYRDRLKREQAIIQVRTEWARESEGAWRLEQVAWVNFEAKQSNSVRGWERSQTESVWAKIAELNQPTRAQKELERWTYSVSLRG